MSDLQTLLPPNASQTEYDLEQSMAHGAQMPIAINTLRDPNSCPQSLLPWLAWELSIDDWDAKWSEDTKRRVIRESVEVHQSKGTVGSIKRALRAAGYGEVDVIERFGWETYNGDHTYDGSITYAAPDKWFEYRIKLTRPITIEQAAQVREILSTVAPARCRLKALQYPEAQNLYDNSIRFDGTYTYGAA